MPDIATFGRSARILPYRENAYRSSIAAFIVDRLFEQYFDPARRIELSLQRAELEEDEARPSQAAITGIIGVVEGAPKTALIDPETSVFHGEVIVTWKNGVREVSLASRGNVDDPKLLRYEAGQNQPSRHEIHPNADSLALNDAVAWLYE